MEHTRARHFGDYKMSNSYMVTSPNQIYLVTHTNVINLKKNYLVTSFKVILF